jgi:hypothetical protein
MSSMFEKGARAELWLAAGLAILAQAGVAQARSEVVSWSHVWPCLVDSFELRYGSAPDDLAVHLDVGRPHQAGGHFSYALDLADDEDVYVCVAAVRGSETSDCSEVVRLDPATVRSSWSEPAPDPARQMWCEDFTSGNLSPDWKQTGADSSDELPLPWPFYLTRFGANNQVLVTTTASPADGIHAHFTGTVENGGTASDWSAYEFSGQMRFSEADAGIGVTFYSLFPDANGYYRLGRGPGGFFRLERDHEDPTYHCDEQPQLEALPGTWYTFRLQVQEQSTFNLLKMKVWPSQLREPDGFQWRCSDLSSTRQHAGAIGVWSAGPGTKRWDSLRVSELPAVAGPLGAPGKPELVP